MPAYERAFAEHEAEIDAIANQPAPPTFDNTIVALENAGRALQRVDDIFGQLVGTDSTDDAACDRARHLAPRRAAHWSKVRMNAALFARIDALHSASATASASAPSRSACWSAITPASAAQRRRARRRQEAAARRHHRAAGDARHRVQPERAGRRAVLHDGAERRGRSRRPAGFRARGRAAAAAEERGMKGKHVITLSRSSVEPFLQFSSRRDLREKAFRAWIARGDNDGKTDNKAIIAETMALRVERARLLGYPTFAHYRLDDAMAKTPEAVRDLLEKVWKPARKARARRPRRPAGADRARRAATSRSPPGTGATTPRSCASARCDFDEAEVKPYFQLDNDDRGGVLRPRTRLFGLTFTAGRGAGLASRRARLGGDAAPTASMSALFFGDYFARPSQAGRRLDEHAARPGEASRQRPPDRPQRDELQQGRSDAAVVRRRAHAVPRIGHGLHGLLSNVTYPTALRHQRADRLGRAAVAALRALVRAAGGAAQVRPPLPRPASRCRRR